jgi:hypothetical protein
MSKQTSVEYLIEVLRVNAGIKVSKQLQEEVLQMEKEQMWEYIKKNYCIGPNSLEFHRLEFEQYYNETYKKEK